MRPLSLRPIAISILAWLLVQAYVTSDCKAQDSLVAHDPFPKSLRITTWNLEWFFDDDLGDNMSDLSKELSAPSQKDWNWKVQVVAQAIATMRPNILALQEIENRRVLEKLTKSLREAHGLSYRIAQIDGFDKATEQEVAILFRDGLVEFSRLEQSTPMFRSEQFYNLSKHLIARFRWGDQSNTEELYVVVVHLRAKPEESDLRKKQCLLVRHWLGDLYRRTPNIIVLGDFNTDEKVGAIRRGSDLDILLQGPTSSSSDDLIDLLERSEKPNEQTHLFLARQFDRIAVTSSLLSNEPERMDLVFSKISVQPQVVIRGQGIDDRNLHWDKYWTIASDERDISDHFPVTADFDFIR